MNSKRLACALLALAAVGGAAALSAQESKLVIGGTTYTKWLWGNPAHRRLALQLHHRPG